MLYDQAILVQAYLDAYQATKKQYYADVVHEILEYVLRDMTSENGGFYSAEDADSEGEEGLFYIWNNKEIQTILNEEEYLFISDILIHYFKKCSGRDYQIISFEPGIPASKGRNA